MLKFAVGIKIEKIGIERLDEAADLEEKYMLPPLTFGFTKEELAPIFGHFLTWGILDNNKLVGKVGYIKEDSGDYELDGMVVSPKYRGQGLGKELINFSLKEMKKIVGTGNIFLYVNPKNTPALILYLKLGFQIAEWIPNKFGDGENRLKLILKK